MIAIDTIIILRDSVPTPTFEPGQPEWDRTPQLKVYYYEILNFMQECIDQNLILNACIGDVSVSSARYDRGRFFSTTSENAQTFADKFCDMTAEFSMKKMWDQYGYDTIIEQSEIDFDTQPMPYQIIPSNGDLFQYQDQAGTPLTPPVV